MTKKFIHTDKSLNGDGCASEFIIPDYWNNSENFVGLSSQKSYSRGMVVYTGVEMSSEKVLEKVRKFIPKEKDTKRFDDLLLSIKSLKVGDIVKSNEKGITKLDKSEI